MKRYRSLLILLGVFICITGINIAWIILDKRPPAWDQSTHFLLGMEYLKAISECDLWKILTVSNFYPPLYHISLVPMIALTNSVDGAVITNFLYLGITIFSIYYIGKLLFTESVGLIASVLYAFFPFIQALSRECMIDSALTAWVCLSLCLLVRSRYFMSSKYSLLFTCSAAAGMLTKWNFIFYIIVPFVVCWVRARQDHKRKAWLSLAGIVLLSSPWYLINAGQIIRKGARYIAIGGAEGDPGIFSLSSLLWYPLSLGEQIFIPAMLIFLWALIVLIMKAQKGKWFLLAWVFIPLSIHTLMSNKDIRYTMPVLPAVAMITALWLLRDGQKVLTRRIWTAVVLVIVGFQTLHASFAVPSFMKRTAFSVLGKAQVLLNPAPPQPHTWMHKELFEQLSSADPEGSQKPVFVTVVSNHPYLHGASLRCYTIINNLPFVIKGYRKRLGEFTRFVIVKTGNRGPGFTLGKINQAVEEIENPASDFNRNFKKYSSLDLPDGSEAVIYKLSVTPYSLKVPSSIQMNLGSIKYKKFTAEKVKIDIVSETVENAQKGIFKRLHLSCDSIQYKGLTLNDLVVNFDDIQIDLPVLIEHKELFFLAVGTVELSVRLKEKQVKKYIKEKCPWVTDVSIIMDEDAVRFKAKGYGIPVSFQIKAGVDAGRTYMWTELSRLKIMYIPVLKVLYTSLVNREFSLLPGKELPFNLALKQIVITEGSIIIQ